AELHHGLDKVAVAFLDDTFLLPGFDEGIDRLGRTFGLSFSLLFGQRGYRLKEPKHQRDRQHKIDESSQNERPAYKALPISAGEEYEWQEAIGENNDDDEA